MARPFANKSIDHTIPVLLTIDETFDIGSDTRTPVDDSYAVPFRFTGTINKLTFNLGSEQLTARWVGIKAVSLRTLTTPNETK
jgi:hypothetical protein